MNPPRATTTLRAYRLLSRALAPLLLGWLWWRGRREPGYRERLAERLGHIPVEPSRFGGLWLHAASVGEVQAARPLIEALLRDWPEHAITVTTQTPTGAAALRATWGDRIAHRYAPIDTPGAVRRFLDRLQPQALLLVERELWPQWLFACAERALPVLLVNARLSAASAQGYRRWPGLMAHAWPRLGVAAADAESAERLRDLGVATERVAITGNLKFDVAPPEQAEPLSPELAARRLVVAGSTHEGDEAAWLDAWPGLREHHPQVLLVLVPRHPQRFDAVAAELQRRGLPFARRSRRDAVNDRTAVLLIDAMGELTHWYRHASVCFVGGTLAPVGGHNPLEPMALGQAFLFGPHTANAQALFDDAQAAGAGQAVRDAATLALAVDEVLRDTSAWSARGEAARALIDANRGAAERTLATVRARLGPADPSALGPVHIGTHGADTLWHDPRTVDAARASGLFDTDAIAEHLATGSGRGQARLVQTDGHGLVLRHYRRGGLMARLSDDRFWREPAHLSRAMREFALLRLMRSWRLPVPAPALARHRPHGLVYSADIAVGLIEGSRNLVQRLQAAPPSPDEWAALGRAIRALHERQVFHADLNAHNLLLDAQGKAWVVDFDKCAVRPGEAWKADNLARLLRSLRKEAGRVTPFHWDEADWALLTTAYGIADAPATATPPFAPDDSQP
ncbi:MAG: 3-deoxy-D-manno-octulosonic acid kinase [Hydrogenophaga sp.]|uniref:3-deoxy-D-manno-octulosonic acid kinase n=1 Tax=Hydrogenophaga sp. TaxID=1904254 RepID=UPI001694E63C|nr:3-deoxy-D-manno-octulosonic acid kinase [Hydrogenophaga sp.]NIM41784.1 3-deoxy-D-manno-octulosonic acid kinase [Hydrogenophaga sp.]NIN27089.1 3-deoxy-D-manno-octulosonic acid kinase [Hydrogenophaga sp.]NIN31790.1 3-deoxy-D-manno-octulosonic acid kinase [Hydrogenophaga sp.]NIN56034.1 3-deoxy-D-manno-octulosonic acid kinase [Hydrogenophaga sp.]NIO52161.1 3-deoxy-D-manno-octulosonic acid kinase [Hydrogenophaga sp.]